MDQWDCKDAADVHVASSVTLKKAMKAVDSCMPPWEGDRHTEFVLPDAASEVNMPGQASRGCGLSSCCELRNCPACGNVP